MEKVRVALLGDGAKWLWTHLKRAFPRGTEILDYYHCSEHIHKMAKLLYTEQNGSCCKRIDKLKSQEENSRRLMNKPITKS